MAHRRSFTRGRSGISDAQRRKKSWFGVGLQGSNATGLAIATGNTGGVAGGSVGLGIVDADQAALTGLLEGTILRIRGSILVPKSTLSTVASSQTTVAFGIGFVTDEAALAGAVPNPASENGADWDGWMFYRSSTLETVDSQGGIMDVKSMRKWNSGTSLVFVAGVETGQPGGASSFEVKILSRILFLLP